MKITVQFCGTDKLMIEFIWKAKAPRVAKKILKKDKIRSIVLPTIRLYIKLHESGQNVIRGRTETLINEWNRKEHISIPHKLEVPNLFGTRGRSHGKQFSHGRRVRDGARVVVGAMGSRMKFCARLLLTSCWAAWFLVLMNIIMKLYYRYNSIKITEVCSVKDTVVRIKSLTTDWEHILHKQLLVKVLDPKHAKNCKFQQ